ncbi:MAG: cyclic nucleotide-binding domain-containing protein [Kofleriaceae bacterium]
MPAAVARPWAVLGGVLRDEDRSLVVTAGGVFALASAGAAMAQAAADALFLAEIGRDSLGIALAISSALLAVVLAIVGGLADRLDRRRVLGTLGVVSAIVLAGLAGLVAIAPAGAAWGTYIGGKQLAAATDLAFWVAIAERVDARRSQRLVPVLAATGGVGAALGALIVIPIASATGPRGVLAIAAVALVLAALGAAKLPASRRVAATPHFDERSSVARGSTAEGQRGSIDATWLARSWRDGARAVRRYPLALHLAIVVGLAGIFGSLAYATLGFAAAHRGGSAAELASLFGTVRGAGQVLTLVVQVAIVPRLLSRIGTGRALLLAPIVGFLAATGLVIAPVLACAIAMQMSARVLDAGIETPAEKLAQTLLPTAARGRIAGFLDGTAKRSGAVIGGVIAAFVVGPAFYIVIAVVAVAWWIAASRIARELPELAIAHAGDDLETALEVIDDRALDTLHRELASDRPERAADLLSRLHAQGRTDARAPLVDAATRGANPTVWRALIAVLDTPAEQHGAALLDAAKAAHTRVRALAIRAVGLAGGVPADAVEQWRDASDPDVALASYVAHLRLAKEPVLPELAGAQEPCIVEELTAELACALAGGRGDHALDAARYLARAIRRERGDAATRAAGLTLLARATGGTTGEAALLRSDLMELARERIDRAASQPAPDTALVSVMRPAVRSSQHDASEVAAAIRLCGALVAMSTTDGDDLRRIARALGEPDDEIRIAAEDVLSRLGSIATAELLATAAYGRRRARDRAAALLANMPVTAIAIDRLVDDELDALEQTAVALTVLADDPLVARRLEERLHEIAHTVLLLVAARTRNTAIARAAVAWRHAHGAHERARALAVIDAALPRALVGRLVEAVDELSPSDRAAALQRAGVPLASRDDVIRTELAGRDRLSRALVLHALNPTSRSAHRETIASAAHAEAIAADPAQLLRRLSAPETEEPDMPSRVETLLSLGKVPLFSALTTRQLADLAERARYVVAKPDEVIVSTGDQLDALVVIEDGELVAGARSLHAGDVIDELACVAPRAADSDFKATRTTRLIRLERTDFEELVDDVPGLASAICRALGERARS